MGQHALHWFPMMHRFYCPDLLLGRPPTQSTGSLPAGQEQEKNPALSGRTTSLDFEQTHHARHVLRLRLGDCVSVFDGRGGVGEAVIAKWPAGRSGGARLRVSQFVRVKAAGPAIDVAVAMPKGPRAGALVHNLSQVGADRLIPLHCQRGAPDPRRFNRRRFERAAIEAAKQCGRPYLLAIEPVTELAELLNRPYDLRLIGMPQTQAYADLPGPLPCPGRLLILIGPEGGWTQQEVTTSVEGGCKPWTFGAHVMRIETASAAAVAIVRYSCERYLTCTRPKVPRG